MGNIAPLSTHIPYKLLINSSKYDAGWITSLKLMQADSEYLSHPIIESPYTNTTTKLTNNIAPIIFIGILLIITYTQQ